MSDSIVTPQTVARQARLSMGFPRQEYWRGLPFPSPGDLPKAGIEPGSPALQEDSLPSKPPGKAEFIKQSKIRMFMKQWHQTTLSLAHNTLATLAFLSSSDTPNSFPPWSPACFSLG